MANTSPWTEGSQGQNVQNNEKPPSALKSSWRKGLRKDISHDHTDIPIIICCLASGLCDSSAFNSWNTFVSMQTGNTIILALGASNQPVSEPYSWLKSLCAIFFFLVGCWFFAQSRHIHPLRRLTLFASFLFQSILIFVSAALVQRSVVPSPVGTNELDPANVRFIELLPIGLLAFQSGGQVVTSRLLGLNEVPTTVLTSLYCDLVSDPHLLAKDNVKRNRRIASVVTLLVGGIIGGWLCRSSVGMAAALWLAGAVKVALAVAWLTWKPKAEVPV